MRLADVSLKNYVRENKLSDLYEVGLIIKVYNTIFF